MKIEQIPLSEINPATYNPRTISESAFAGLKESLKKFGMPQPLVVNKRNNVLVSGHQRAKAAESLGWQTVPVVYVDLSLSEEKALNVTLNNQAISGTFTEGLQELLQEIKLELPEYKELMLDSLEVNLKTIEDINTEDKEIDPNEFNKFQHKCPRCNFEFNAKKD
jgi:ParB/RepB/Spo0J family partition protein